MGARGERLLRAAVPLVALLAVVGALLAVEVGINLSTADVPRGSIAAEASLAIRHMVGLAWLVGLPLSLVAWFAAKRARPYPRALRLMGCGLAGLATVAWLSAVLWPLRGSPAGPPDVLLIVVDTLRADYVTLERTPSLARLSWEGIGFTHAYSNAPWTLPSFGTMLTGRFPRDHRAGVAGDRGSSLGPLRKDVETLAERFRSAGYQTVGLTTNPHLREQNGLHRGFDAYRNMMRDHMLFSATFPIAASTRFAPASVQTSRALAWLGIRDPERPIFLMLHYMDPHLPRTPSASLLGAERRAQVEGSPEALAYGAMVRAADRSIGRLHLRRSGDTPRSRRDATRCCGPISQARRWAADAGAPR